MSTPTHVTLSRTSAVVAGVILLLVGAGGAWVLTRSAGPDEEAGMNMASGTGARPAEAPPSAAPPSPEAAIGDAPLPDVEVTLTEEAVKRAGIEVAPVSMSGAGAGLTIPGVIEPDAYRRVAVTPLVGGRVTRVQAELGEQVRRGAPLALIYSPGLAEAQTRYLSMRAELEPAAQELKRTERLVEIGAASQQELERIRAGHTTAATAVEGARTQLVLLGMNATAVARLRSAADITSTITVPAPIDGVVTERQANVGLNVDTSTPLFTVVDLSTVWVVGDLYEKDFPQVRVGSRATVTMTAYPGQLLTGRVGYIDPQLNEQTRTARVRVEVPNPRRELRLGMFAEVRISETGGATAVTIPREAVQTIGERQFVYLAKPGEPGRYVEREVQVGSISGDTLEIASGVRTGDAVVSKGSFFVRAERERLGLRQPGGAAPTSHAGHGPPQAQAQEVRISVTEKGFEPSRVSVPRNQTTRLQFLRTTDNTCAKELIVPALKVKRELPLNQPVVVELPPQRSGEVTFSCGMDMLRGTIVVQ